MEDSQNNILLAQAFRLFLIGSVIWVLPGLLPSVAYGVEFLSDIVSISSSALTIVFFILAIRKISKVLSA